MIPKWLNDFLFHLRAALYRRRMAALSDYRRREFDDNYRLRLWQNGGTP
jgi:hypothetical protein